MSDPRSDLPDLPRALARLARRGLLAAWRPVLARLLEDGRRGLPGEALVGWLVTVREPSGYLIAAGLQRRFGHRSPEEILLPALAGQTPPEALLAGVGPARELAELLGDLARPAPGLAGLAAGLRAGGPPGARQLPVIVAACGGAELYPLLG